MSAFRFKAVDRTNRMQCGVLTASSRDAAAAELNGQGLTVIELIVATGGGTRTGGRVRLAPGAIFSGSPTLRELQLLLGEWARSLQAGLTIADAVAISNKGRRGRLSRVAASVQEALQRGATLQSALAEHTPNLPVAALAMIAAAERSGSLPAALPRLAEQLTQSVRLRAEIRSALVYPAIVVATAGAVVAVLFEVVIPAIDEIVGDKADALPVTARLVLQANRLFHETKLTLLSGAGVCAILIAVATTHPRLKPVFDRLRLRVPFLRTLYLANEGAQFARSLAVQISGGVPLARATGFAARAFALAPLRSAATNLERRLTEGRALSEAIAADLPALPSELARFTRIGEQTGRLADLLAHAADELEERARRQARTMTSLVTPTITIGLGLVVGFIVFSLMSAVIGINAVALQ